MTVPRRENTLWGLISIIYLMFLIIPNVDIVLFITRFNQTVEFKPVLVLRIKLSVAINLRLPSNNHTFEGVSPSMLFRGICIILNFFHYTAHYTLYFGGTAGSDIY